MNGTLQDVIELINIKPQEWRQASWVDTVQTDQYCGTTMCIAGWATVLSGQANLEQSYDEDGRLTGSTIVWPQGHDKAGEELTEDDFLKVGMEVLELTDTQAKAIFHQTNITDPQQMTNHIKTVLADPDTYPHALDEECTC